MLTPPAQPALQLRVFLASPGDVADERALALRALEDLPYDPFLRDRVVINTVAWDKPGADTPMLATLTPQEAISQQRPKPSQCDIVVVIFWSRMGTPLPAEYLKDDGSPYRSGTEWEYLDAIRASEKDGRPRVLVYRRSEVPSVELNDPEKAEKERQWQSVEAFFESFHNPDGSIRAGYNPYDTPDTFGKRLTEHLKEIVKPLLVAHDATIVSDPGGAGLDAIDTDKAEEPTEPTAPELWVGSPFPGLRAFDQDDAPIYFGRGRETDGLLHRLSQGNRFIAVVGASGSGKSSLVAAGLVPRLRSNALPGSRDWVIARFAPGEVGDNPFIALLSGFKSILDSNKRKLRDEAARLEQDPQALQEIMDLVLQDRPQWSELLLFVDQFEELFTVVAEQYRKPFCALLAHGVALPRLRIVLTLRADFYHRCVDYPDLAELLRTGSFPLAAPDRVALEEMITRPADRAGLAFDEGLAERILDDTESEPGALPLLAFALSELYEAGNKSGRLSLAAYEAFDGIQGAVSQRAESTYADLDADARATLSNVFRELVEVKEAEGGWVATRRRASLDVAAATPPAGRLVDAFVAARLLVLDEDEDQQSLVEVAHEALLRNWDRIVRWIEATGEDLWQLRELRRSAGDWDQNDRKGEYLWPRPRWRQAKAAIARLSPTLEGAERLFLAASRRGTWRKGLTRSAAALAVVGVLGWFQYENVTFKHAMTLVPVRLAWLPGKLGYFEEPETMRIEPGEFWRGEGVDRHKVRIAEPLHMGKYEVTFFEYLAFAHATGREIPDTGGWWQFGRPVIDVTWEDATAYAKWLSDRTDDDYRLPTEAEWEYAARAGTTTTYFWGDKIGENNANCSGCGSKWDNKQTAPVGSFEPNLWKLYDMHGNVWEWVQDCHGNYSEAPRDGTPAPESGGCHRVLRGGSWYGDPAGLRAAYRDFNSSTPPDYRDGSVGFRVVCRPLSSTEC